eukprot:g17603.t1
MVVCATALPTLCLGQGGGVERTEDGKERGPNSTLAKKAELWLPIALVCGIVLLVIVFCIRKARSAASVDQEEEDQADDIEEAKDEKGLEGPVERITRTAVVWDQKAWDKKSFAPGASVTTASASATSSSSYEGAMSGQDRRARSNEHRHVSGALRSASKLPRFSSDRLKSPVHGGAVAVGGRRSGGGRGQRGDAGRGERVREGVTVGRESGGTGGSSQPEAPRAHQDALSVGNPREI